MRLGDWLHYERIKGRVLKEAIRAGTGRRRALDLIVGEDMDDQIKEKVLADIEADCERSRAKWRRFLELNGKDES
jgi:hypothetical protein|tara:strand:+ start:172 stop:396 length:225 start_codon:yes stop_codon:yes gene_type:complete